MHEEGTEATKTHPIHNSRLTDSFQQEEKTTGDDICMDGRALDDLCIPFLSFAYKWDDIIANQSNKPSALGR